MLLTHVQDLYKRALKQYPESAGLRIRYAFFLLEYPEDRTNALKQFKKAERHNPALDESFVIYRSKKLLQDARPDGNNQRGAKMGVVSSLVYNNYFRQCRKKLEKAARLHMDFWNKLNTQMPDVLQLMKLGTKISKVLAEIEEYWGEMQRINSNMPQAVTLYANFLRDVLNDVEASYKLLKSIGGLQERRGREFLDEASSGKDQFYFVRSYTQDGSPCVCLSGEQSTLGLIRYVNKAFCRLLGYSESQLLNRNINTLIPKGLAEHHDRFLREASEKPDTVTHLGLELLVPCKMRNGYLLPLYLFFRALPSYSNNLHFVATFKPDRQSESKNMCYLLLDAKGALQDVSERRACNE